MRISWAGLALSGVLLAFPLGCATVDARRDYERAGARIEAATGKALMYQPEDDRAADDRVAELILGGLASDECVQIALLNNPKMRASFLRIGMARADVVQSGLWTNPTLGISFRFPDAGGLADFELNLAQNIADLWMIPARTKVAERELERAVLETAREAAGLVADTKVAYFNAVAGQRALAIARDNQQLVQNLLSITQARLEAGAIGALDVNLVRGLVLKAEVEVRTAQLEAATARRTLAMAIGFSGLADDLVLIDDLPPTLSAPFGAERLLIIASESRLDLQAARKAVAAAEGRVEAEYAKVFQNVEIGFALERNARRALPGRNIAADTARASIANGGLTAPDIESRGQRQLAKSQEIEAILGPSLSLTLPIFDQNRAQIAKARFAYQEASALLDALERGIAQETRQALDRATTAGGVATLYATDVLPQARETLELSQSAYQAGNANILTVIDAQRSLLETQRAYVTAMQSAANAMVDLERATARPIGALLQSNAPATQPTSSRPAQGGNR